MLRPKRKQTVSLQSELDALSTVAAIKPTISKPAIDREDREDAEAYRQLLAEHPPSQSDTRHVLWLRAQNMQLERQCMAQLGQVDRQRRLLDSSHPDASVRHDTSTRGSADGPQMERLHVDLLALYDALTASNGATKDDLELRVDQALTALSRFTTTSGPWSVPNSVLRDWKMELKQMSGVSPDARYVILIWVWFISVGNV
jgi:hypothetical protein